MLGSILLGGAFGLIKGYSSKKQGKGIIKTADSIQRTYESISKLEPLFAESLKEHKETAGKIKKYQEDTAKLQYDKENSKLKTSLEAGIRNVINQYVTVKENLKEQVLDTRSKLLLSNPTKNVESSSYQYDSLTTLANEAGQNQRVLLENQVNSIGQLTDENIEQGYRLGTDYDNTLGAIRKNYFSSIANAENQYTQDVNQMYNWIEAGKSTANQLRNQGRSTVVQGESMITNTLWETGLNLYDYYFKPKIVNDIYDETITPDVNTIFRGFGKHIPFIKESPKYRTGLSFLGGSNGIFR